MMRIYTLTLLAVTSCFWLSSCNCPDYYTLEPTAQTEDSTAVNTALHDTATHTTID